MRFAIPTTDLAQELADRFEADEPLAEAFAALTPGRQREYNIHISQAKQASTRQRRVDACVPKIRAGRGFRDRDDKRPPPPKAKAGDGPVLLSGGNPQIAKGDGREPVEAYLAAMPGWKQPIGRQLDALIGRTVPEVRCAVRWNSPFYGTEEQGWFASFHCFDRYVKVTFLNGGRLDPLPPVASKDADTRYAHVHEDEPIDEGAYEAWVRQAAAVPGWFGF